MSLRLARALPLFALTLCANANADDTITIYRCTDASGALTLRDTPCANGQQQHAVEMQRPQDPPPDPARTQTPAPTPVPTSPPAPAVRETPTIARTPPQPMYECITFEGERYDSDDARGNPRWVPLWVLGISPHQPRNLLGDRVGAPRPKAPSNAPGPPELPPAVGLALTPGTWIRDRCRRLPQAEACERLRERRDDLRRQYFSGPVSQRDALRPLRHAVDERLHNDCGVS